MSGLGNTLADDAADAPAADPGQSRPMDAAVFKHLHHADCRSVCSSCNLREICLPVGLTKLELDYIDRRLVAGRRKVPRGGYLYRTGERFDSLYAIWTGSFKTCQSMADGREQVTGFQLGGDLLGLDGIDSRQHGLDAVALEDSWVCVIRFEDFEDLAQEVGSLRQQFHRIMPGSTVVEQRDDYLYAQFETPQLRFVDDVEFWYDPVAQTVAVRSASRLGRKDFGVNRARVEAIRAQLLH